MGLPRKNVGTEKDEWGTPRWLFNMLNRETPFKLDAAASKENALCEKFFSKENSALDSSWKGKGPAFMNPPHSRVLVEKMMQKANEESQKGTTVVCLVPASLDTHWWHRWVLGWIRPKVFSGYCAAEIRPVAGRVDYVGVDLQGNKIKQSPTFASCVIIFNKTMVKDLKNSQKTTVCGLDDPCDEGYTKYEGQMCSCGYRDCYDDTFQPVLGKPIWKPKKTEEEEP